MISQCGSGVRGLKSYSGGEVRGLISHPGGGVQELRSQYGVEDFDHESTYTIFVKEVTTIIITDGLITLSVTLQFVNSLSTVSFLRTIEGV